MIIVPTNTAAKKGPQFIGLAGIFYNTLSANYVVTEPDTTIFVTVNSVNVSYATASIDGVAMTAIGSRIGSNQFNSSFGWLYAKTGLTAGTKTITLAHDGPYIYGVAVAYSGITTLGSPFYTAQRIQSLTVPGSTEGKLIIGSLNSNDTTSNFAGGTQRAREVGQTIYEVAGSAASRIFTASCDGGNNAMAWSAAAVS